MLKARGGELLPEGQLMMKFVQLCLGLQHVHAKVRLAGLPALLKSTSAAAAGLRCARTPLHPCWI